MGFRFSSEVNLANFKEDALVCCWYVWSIRI